MQAKYPLKIQAIRSKNQQARLYVYFPLPLAAAIGLGAGEEVQWELLDRGELHLVRNQPPEVQANSKGHPTRRKSAASQKGTAKAQRRRVLDGSDS
jgi:hypothetical protein